MIQVLIFGILSFTSLQATESTCKKFQHSVTKGNSEQKLKRFLEVQWTYLMNEFPEWATAVGFPGQDERWTDYSLKAIERRRFELKCQRRYLRSIDRRSLSATDRTSYDLALYRIDIGIEADTFDDAFMPVNHLEGFHIDIVHTLNEMPSENLAGYENVLKRLERIPELEAQTVALMREGLRRRVTPVKEFLEKINEQVTSLTVEPVENGPLFQKFKDINPSIANDEKLRLQNQASKIIKERVYPALKEFSKFLHADYIPNARTFIAFEKMPNGKAWYKHLVKRQTTTDLSPDILHQIGLREVERITNEMNKIREQVSFKGDLKAFNEFLLKDRRFQFDNEQDLLSGYRDIAKRIDPELPRLFRTLPRLTYGIRPIEAFRAASAPGAQYNSGSAEAGRPGWFMANTSDLPSRPKWDMETLTLHEAVPGHHLQITIAQELKDLPPFRRFGGFTAFSEGWALYAESLGSELGLFKDPYSRYGNLSAEMMRAVRLVLDTGLHTQGWSQAKALAYYRSQMPITDVDSENEVNRYITWPGQALAYKVGQLKIQQLRQESQKVLGQNFDIREFHDVVLGNGSVPMSLLEKNIREWLKTKKSKKTI